MDWEVIVGLGTAAAALGTLLGLFIAQRHQRRNELAARISTEVEAKLGGILLNLRALEEDVRNRLRESIETVDSRQKQLTEEIVQREQTLREMVDRASEATTQIEHLLARSAAVLPSIEHVETVPFQLYYQAAQSNDLSLATALLLKILETRDVEARLLELAGDLAREKLSNQRLARKLYERAVAVDPEYYPALSELLRLRAMNPAESDSAKEQILQLAHDNPDDRTVVHNAFNVLIHRDEYDEIVTLAEELLPRSKFKATLWRNIAVARAHLDASDEQVAEAYERAMELARTADIIHDRGAFINTARPYIRFLLNGGHRDQAEAVLVQAQRVEPGEAQLHILRGEVEVLKGNYKVAERWFRLGQELGDPVESEEARRRLRDLELLDRISSMDHDAASEAEQALVRAGATHAMHASSLMEQVVDAREPIHVFRGGSEPRES
ncbi:MAG TPA: hypothetical protein VHG08_14250 [Longimicrobium sp.]|nr:hypothetical protein [Longimicrobium sp.]